MQLIRKYPHVFIGIIAFIYYISLASLGRTWMFVSGDSGDWLAGSIWWMNVQPYGSPLYILLGHLTNSVFPHTLVPAMTILLSVLPASITVGTVFLICRKLTNEKIAIVSSLVLMGCAVFLSQATILEEYSLATMFVTLAFWFYINDKKKLTILMLGLGSAVHIIVVAISVIWLLAHLNKITEWVKYFWIYVVVGILPYSMVLILMALPTPKLLAGNLSIAGLNNYLGSTGTIGSLSLFETPKRLLDFVVVISSSLGLAIIPIVASFKGITKYGKPLLLVVLTASLVLWMYLTDNDSSTWTFLTFAMPLIMVLVAIGLQKLGEYNIVMIGAGCLIIINSLFLNANGLANKYPLAQEYEATVRSVPDGSYIICNSGGSYGLDNYYLMASGKDIRPIFFNGDIPDLSEFDTQWQSDYIKFMYNYLVNEQHIKSAQAITQVNDMVKRKNEVILTPRYQGYLEWMQDKFGLQGTNTIQQVRYLLSNGDNIYIVLPTVTPYWDNVFITESINNYVAKVVGINENY